MPNKRTRQALYIAASLAMSAGAVISAFTDIIPISGPIILLAILPPAMLMLLGAWINQRVLIPNYFMQGRYGIYAFCCMLLSISVPLSGIALEAGIRATYSLPDRIHNYLSPWILLDSLSTATLLMVIMLGMALTRVYKLWKAEVKAEKEATIKYAEATEKLTKSIHSQEILRSLSDIEDIAPYDAEVANTKLRALSDRLRHELYDLPHIQAVESAKRTSRFSKLSEFIASKRYTLLRDICLKVLIGCVSVTAIFDAPDHPDLSMQGLWAFLGMAFGVGLLTYGNKSLSKHFLNKGRLKSYAIGALLFLIAMTITIIGIEIGSYVHNVHSGDLSLPYQILATIASFTTITLYFGGVTALIMLHNWLRTEKRVVQVEAETAKSELQFLQSQINPHFLFNVLNNAGIMIYEDTNTAIGMLIQLREMFEYQFDITKRKSVKLQEEIEFLRNYLLLEQSRKSPFDFMIEADKECESLEIPTLLLIPFVENASKHSSGHRNIAVRIKRMKTRILFECENDYEPEQKKNPGRGGGLGISNTRRRLELLYSGQYKLEITTRKNRYKIILTLPLQNEMPYSRR